ncbi:hypothetical protein [Microbaculum marinisediminis]|uniref:Uncharacterized protein n=1 Tax=Microbaculum marinisediminis TaxID=2931392 RepID=A0AAW5QTL7_9HYPH|nr:hypothetical protein [Microbaculum sp. A6E488]MCT8971013.1 hypothetical protein [Microbaculum sp. A6E488]
MTEESPKPGGKPEGKHTWHDDTPFPKRWIGYVAIKVIVLAVAVGLGLWWAGLL